MPNNRFRDAYSIAQGACNVRGIARSLVEAADAAAAEGLLQEGDAAVRLIVTQLAHLCRASADCDDWYDLYATCERRMSEEESSA